MTVDAASAALQRVHHEFEPVLSENNSPLTKKVGTPNRQRATVFGVPAQLGLDLRRKALARSSPSQILREVLVFAPRVPTRLCGSSGFPWLAFDPGSWARRWPAGAVHWPPSGAWTVQCQFVRKIRLPLARFSFDATDRAITLVIRMRPWQPDHLG